MVLASAAARVYRLGDANVWWDEALAIWAVRKGLAGATAWTAADVHPPLYFWSLWGWVQLFGESELASRLLSVVFGVLTVLVAYRLGRRLGGERLGLLAGWLTGLARFHVWWSQELRMYVLAGLLGMLSLYHFLGWLHREGAARGFDRAGWWHLGGAALAALGALYSVLIMAGMLLVENLVAVAYLLWGGVRARWRTLGRWAIAQVAVGLGLGIWLLYSWGAMSTWSVAQPFGWMRAARLYATLLTTGISVEIERYTWQVALPLAVLVAGAWVGWRRWRERGRPRAEAWDLLTLALAALVPPLLVYLATLPRAMFYTPMLEARYLVAFAPAFWLLLAWALDALVERARAVGWACIAAVAAVWLMVLPGHYTTRYLTDELQSMVRTIASQTQDGDLVLLNSGTRYPIWSYYYDGLPWPSHKPEVVLVGSDSQVITQERMVNELSCAIGDAERVWMAEVDIGLTDPERVVATWLNQHYVQVQALGFGPNTLRLYDAEGELPSLVADYAPEYPVPCQGPGYALQGVDLPVSKVLAGERLHVGLLWDRAPAEARLLLRHASGQIVAARLLQSERAPRAWRQQIELAIPDETPQEAYGLLLELPDGQTCQLRDVAVVGDRQLGLLAEPRDRIEASLGDVAQLRGVTVHHPQWSREPRGEVTVRAGATLVLDLYWAAEGRSETAYTVFAQLLGEAHNPRTQGPVWGQHDSGPSGYAAPTTDWRAGDFILDRHLIEVEADAPEGIYQLQVGMYDPSTGARLSVTDAEDVALGDRVLLPVTVRVRR
jgi:4-amino-4-deoxy-L-arabinose transferase-like glycosyltransferase